MPGRKSGVPKLEHAVEHQHHDIIAGRISTLSAAKTACFTRWQLSEIACYFKNKPSFILSAGVKAYQMRSHILIGKPLDYLNGISGTTILIIGRGKRAKPQ